MASGAFHSRLLRKVEQDIALAQQAGQQMQALCLQARRAGLLARHGQLELARQELTRLHQAAFASPHPGLGAWLHLAEALVAYYSHYDVGARERLLRADSLARSAGLREVQLEAQAFLAHLAFADHKPETLVEHAQACMALAQPEDSPALARLHMVMGLALHLSDSQEAAQPWYAKARALAAQCGDDALTSALLYNRAVIGVARLREAELADGLDGSPALMAAVDSVAHFDRAMGVVALDILTPLLRAQALVSAGEFAQALPLYQDSLPETLAHGLGRLGSSLMADLAWCRVHLGAAEQEAALALAQQAELELDPACHDDDRGVTHARLAQVYVYLGQPEQAAAQQALARSAWQAYRSLQARWRTALAGSGLQPLN
ncbi:hypothetical protein HNQ51_000372 [Inhella inkyongensis]|uniref:MalT-like TPR region domain-containing protein n=1 Tax=Inhella inkyongensis TaxID=392593 RepID=A0A840S3G9_9BURK|nr:hypothetical protein [Inhella inkyongensis]MBB5203079.1 hypothetical protein [Inhella inkyongensis]